MAPKGDAEELKADLDDGFARVSNLLIEALCLSNVVLSEIKTVLFVVRRTYGWARGRDPMYKADTMSAQDIADGTGLKLAAIRDALRSLRRKRVLIQVAGAPGSPCAYGVNTDISEWGKGDAAWDSFRARFKDAKDAGVYDRSHTMLPGQDPLATAIPPLLPGQDPPSSSGNTPPLVVATGVGATSQTDTGAEGTPTENGTENGTETPTPLAPNVGAAPDETPVKPKRQTRKTDLVDHDAERTELLAMFTDDERPLAIDLLEVFRCANKTQAISSSKECSVLRDLLKIRTQYPGNGALAHGLTVTIAKGINNTGYVKQCAKSYATRPVNEGGLFAGQAGGSVKEFIQRPGEVKVYEDKWDTGDHMGVSACKSDGVWCPKHGMPLTERVGWWSSCEQQGHVH